jgi:hypothetical protein
VERIFIILTSEVIRNQKSFFFTYKQNVLQEQRAIRVIVVDNLSARTYVNGSFIIQNEEKPSIVSRPSMKAGIEMICLHRSTHIDNEREREE